MVLVQADGTVKILRQGAVPQEAVAAEAPLAPASCEDRSLSPGTRYRHYAPTCRLYRGDGGFRGYGVAVGYEGREYAGADLVYRLGKESEPLIIAGNLYATLRKLDTDGIAEAWVDCRLPEQGLYLALLDRLHRACHA